MSSCFCGLTPRKSRERLSPDPTVAMKFPDISRETSMVSAVTCLESQSTSAFSPRHAEDPVLRTARERVEKFKEWLTDPRFGSGSN